MGQTEPLSRGPLEERNPQMLTAAKGSRHTSRRDSEINLTRDMSLSSLLAGGGGAGGGAWGRREIKARKEGV